MTESPTAKLKGPILITTQGELSHQLCESFLNLGLKAQEVTDEDDFSGAGTFIDLTGLRPMSSLPDICVLHEQLFRRMKKLGQTFSDGRLLVVLDAGGCFGFDGGSRAAVAGVSGLVKTIQKEWNSVRGNTLDIAQGRMTREQLKELILQEIPYCDHAEIAYVGPDQRRVIENRPQRIAKTNPVAIPKRAVFLVTGGGRGVTAACLEELCRKHPLRLVLIGRTVLHRSDEDFYFLSDEELRFVLLEQLGDKTTPKELTHKMINIRTQEEITTNIRRFKKLGAEVLYFPTDLGSPHELSALVDHIHQEWGPIYGVLHGAGVIRDRLLVDKSEEDFHFVYQTKVQGAFHLLQAVKDDPVQMVVFFTSVAARYGNKGQCDYALANEALNKLAQQEKKSGLKIAKAFNWGPWDGGMVDKHLKSYFTQNHIGLIPLSVGAQAFAEELCSGDDHVEVVWEQ